MNIVALQTARRCSKSVPKKNIMAIQGVPLFMHNCFSAMASDYIDELYVSTDDPFIKRKLKGFCFDMDKGTYAKVIDRPKELCQDNSSHQETILHGLEYIEKDMGERVDILVILLGNCKGAYTEDLDKGIKYLKRHKDVDSIMSVAKFNMFNPMRAFKIENNCLVNAVDMFQFKDIEKKNEKNSMGDTYFFNGSFWICRRANFYYNGMQPFPWLGEKIVPLIQDPINQEIDDKWQVKLL